MKQKAEMPNLFDFFRCGEREGGRRQTERKKTREKYHEEVEIQHKAAAGTNAKHQDKEKIEQKERAHSTK